MHKNKTGGAKGSRAKITPEMGGEFSIKHSPDGAIIVSNKTCVQPEAQMGAEPINVTAIKTKAQTVALTATGTAVGALVAGPVGAIVGAGVGGLVDWYRHQKKVAADAAAAAASVPRVIVGPALNVKISPLALSALTKAAPQGYPRLKLIKMAQTAGTATHPATVNPDPNTVAAKNAADALYGYFQQYPFDRMLGDIFWKATKTGALVKSFQSAYNADASTNAATGPLSVSGYYDSKTAGALTFYTHNPIDPDPNAG